jgi:hypothetical protein
VIEGLNHGGVNEGIHLDGDGGGETATCLLREALDPPCDLAPQVLWRDEDALVRRSSGGTSQEVEEDPHIGADDVITAKEYAFLKQKVSTLCPPMEGETLDSIARHVLRLFAPHAKPDASIALQSRVAKLKPVIEAVCADGVVSLHGSDDAIPRETWDGGAGESKALVTFLDSQRALIGGGAAAASVPTTIGWTMWRSRLARSALQNGEKVASSSRPCSRARRVNRGDAGGERGGAAAPSVRGGDGGGERPALQDAAAEASDATERGHAITGLALVTAAR